MKYDLYDAIKLGMHSCALSSNGSGIFETAQTGPEGPKKLKEVVAQRPTVPMSAMLSSPPQPAPTAM